VAFPQIQEPVSSDDFKKDKPMLIETIQPFDTKEDAEDSLAGIKNLPGFLFAYIREPYHASHKYDLVYVFECSGDTQHLQKQRAISSLEVARKSLISAAGNLSDDHQTMLDLLSYPNPTGLHATEARYRDFGRALLALD
jgi:hypothetical protein